MKKLLLFLLVCFIAVNLSKAQDDRTDRIGFGFGPSMMYGDNTGYTRKLKFKVLPAVALDYHKKLHAFVDVKGSIGWQMVNSGDFYDVKHLTKIAEHNLPYGFKGNAFFADVMPVYHFNPNMSGYLPADYKVYLGVGLGVAHVMRTDSFMSLSNGQLTSPRSLNGSNTSVYVPLRTGVSTDVDEYWEIALEPGMMLSFFGELDGNNLQQKLIKPDILFQFQFFIRRKIHN